MTAIDLLLTRHADLGQEITGDRSVAPPSRNVAILTCMDARIHVSRLFDLREGEAHILRNAGGVVTEDTIRSLALSQRKLGTREVMIVQHTSCGVSAVTEDSFKDEVESDTGLRPTWSVEAFRDVHASVRTSMQRVRQSPYLPHRDGVRGFVYDIQGGGLTEVE